MQKTSTPAASDVVELLKAALSQGHTVILPARLAGAEPPLAATLSLKFKLTHAEGLALAKLLEGKHASREALRSANSNPVSGSKGVDVIIHRLRRKLAPHDIAIDTVRGQGFGLAEGACNKIHQQLAEYDAGVAPTTPFAASGERA